MKNFFTSLLGSLVALLIFFGGGALLGVILLVGLAAIGGKHAPQVENGSYLVFDLSTAIKDAPEDIAVILIEKPKAYGVFGAHGIGEPPMGPPAPAVAAAVYNAVGVWIDSMPITREKLLTELRRVR